MVPLTNKGFILIALNFPYLVFIFSFPIIFIVLNFYIHILPISTHPIFNGIAKGIGSTIHSPYPFIEYVIHRPWVYYFYSLFLINPLYVYLWIVLNSTFKKFINERLFLLLYILYSLCVFSMFALLGGGFQTRYIVFIEPFTILFFCLSLNEDKNGEFPLLFLFLVHNVVLVLMNVVFNNSAELFPFIEMLWTSF